MITYKINADGDIDVRLAGRKAGEIRMTPHGFRYYPKGSATGGDTFPSLAACKASLEEPEPDMSDSVSA